MREETELRQDLVLVGGGHSHALALLMLAMQPIEGLRVTLISPDSHTPYSGMLPGLIAGHYQFEDSHIDLARLCQWAGVRFIATAVTALDPGARQLTLPGRPPVSYDLLSLDIGSQPELDSVPGAREYAIPVKPVASLWQRWQVTHDQVSRADSVPARNISLVGGGAGSVELALAMAQRLQDKNVNIALWCAAPEILQGYNPRARRSVMGSLQQNGIAVHLGARVAEVGADFLQTENGTRAPYDDLFWCTGAAAAPWIAASGLPTDQQGFLAVTDTGQSTGDDRVFGAGDIATLVADPHPKAGVYAVRQAPFLAHNLRALLLGQTLRHFRPQRRFLSLISLGGRFATANKGFFSATGAWVWRWKDSIDRAFMARFEQLPEMPAPTQAVRLPELGEVPDQAICGGCGAKVGADALRDSLRQLGGEFPDHFQFAGDTSEIPAVAGAKVVQSVDVLRQMVSDPWVMGRIAANHALSDLYASGARPVSALATITLPFASSEMLQRDLLQLLAGALHEFQAVNCTLNGGHSMQGPELNIGFVVNGVPGREDGRLLSKNGGSTGDRLLLTKPLGTGVLLAAHMQQQADGREVSKALEVMVQSNAAAAELALEYGASACTDVTGFGLAGHLLEMLEAGQAARLSLQDIPLLDGALQKMRNGLTSTMQAANETSAKGFVQVAAAIDDVHTQMLFDPQTSGGLLIAIAPDRVDALCARLQQQGYDQAQVIGQLMERIDERAILLE